MTWREVLTSYQEEQPPLFDVAFVQRWGDQEWQPNADDQQAAGKLHTQIVSRITTQRLGYADGVEIAALDSVYSLFQTSRNIVDAHPTCRHFDALTWNVLNRHIRLFTAKWHRESERGALAALDATDEFRADLARLQGLLRRFDQLLLFLRDGVVSPEPAHDGDDSYTAAVAAEMQRPVHWGISSVLGGISSHREVAAINGAERDAIAKRRHHYGLRNSEHATGLAISGGGIRSATFALGVLVSLTGRGLLHQFDYLSTVSGGGYLGAFLSAFVQCEDGDVGLRRDQLPFRREEGEAAALRHLRHYSKYLSMGSLWQRIKMLSAQLYGMALNSLALVWLLTMTVAAESWVRTSSVGIARGDVLKTLSWLLVAAAILSLILLRLRPVARYADVVIAAAATIAIASSAWLALDRLHAWYGGPSARTAWLCTILVGIISVCAAALAFLFPRALKQPGLVVMVALSSCSAPLFMLGLYSFIYVNRTVLDTPADILGVTLPRIVLIALLGWIIYVFVFNINATAPHRHYRKKLGDAYLIQRRPDSATSFESNVAIPLSNLNQGTHKSPYHLINCALNVPTTKNAAIQGRLTDFFLFSSAYSGSPLIGYQPTQLWERLDPHLDLGTAMAISGAAAAPQMGLATIGRFRFWLALFNIRLGYWARRPAATKFALGGAPGIGYLFKEMLGWMDERSKWINLSDGGHIENLGLYELLRRRCKYILAIDGEQDPQMTFHGLTTLQRLAAIDLGVQIDIDLDDLRLNEHGLSRSHFRFCRVRYPKGSRGADDDFGYLLYVKLSLTGNEGEFIRRLRADEPAFPHHPTIDQFFTEARFEAYRSLGEHIGDKLFLRAIVGDLAHRTDLDLELWFHELGKSLLAPLATARR